MEQQQKIIVDTDVGIDDAQAILMALADKRSQVIAITCVGGNTKLENVCRNSLKILALAERPEIPVFARCKAPIIGNKKFLPYWHGDDGLGDCDPPLYDTVDTSLIQSEHAANALIRLARKHPGEINLVCLAPLTNVAIAIRLDPDFTKYLKGIFIMGGNHSGEGNETITAEFNFHHDPEAASIVLTNAECPVVMVGWEVCTIAESRFDPVWTDEYFNQTTPQGQFLHKIHEKSLARLRAARGDGIDPRRSEMIMCDEWAMAVCLDPTICLHSELWSTNVELAGYHTRGQCVVDKRFEYPSEMSSKSKVVHVLKLDREKMKARLMSMATAESLR